MNQIVSKRMALAGLCALGGVASQALSSQSLLSSEVMASTLVSAGSWRAIMQWLGGTIQQDGSGRVIADVGFFPLFCVWFVVAVLSSVIAAGLVCRTTRSRWSESLATACLATRWWWLMGLWELLRLFAFIVDWQSLVDFLMVSPMLWLAISLAGWLAQPFAVSNASHSVTTFPSQPDALSQPRSHLVILAMLIGTYVTVFTAMNWTLWFNLRVPHGDSAMYEEHLWNLTHGKGFRSYLDQGLFLGEHIQVFHLLLLPLHWLWPSHLNLELCQSTALALGAIPVYRMTTRSTGSSRAGLLMASAYLLYSPLHSLDIEIDLKTFRPESFCVPCFLFAFDALESGHWRRFVALLLLALSAKEDYSIVVASIGVWLSATAWWRTRQDRDSESSSASDWSLVLGVTLAVFGVMYLFLATRVVIPWFRSGEELHYVRYFSKFGNSMSEVVWTMLTDPRLLLGELLTIRTALFGLSLLLPLGFLPLLSPGRLAVALPLFGILSLNELAADTQHHFHAPLVPVIFWATSVGIASAGRVFQNCRTFVRQTSQPTSSFDPDSFARQFVWTSAFACGLFLSAHPASIIFWDPHAKTSYWQLYVRDPRADHFEKVLAQIPLDKNVASTDFVHPRFTHHARSYDYSHYLRKVANYEDRVPDDTDFIVIDTQHPYSDAKFPNQLREIRNQPDRWETLPDQTDGYFIVLKRR